MSLIYKPTGRAREYSPLALNVYTEGCDHGCTYCYCRDLFRGKWGKVAKPRNLKGLGREAAKASRQILLSFVGDPYCEAEAKHGVTSKALGILSEARCSVAILTKGGYRMTRDFDLLKLWPDGRIMVGATLTFMSPSLSQGYEPGAASPHCRIEGLSALHAAGIRTFASIEPVIDPTESIRAIAASLPYVDGYKVGKLNHAKSKVDWLAFGTAAVNMIRLAGKKLYVKEDLRMELPAHFLRPEECNPETVMVEDRPKTP